MHPHPPLNSRPSFSVAAPVVDYLSSTIFQAPLAFGAGVLEGSTLSRRLGLSRWIRPGRFTGYLNPLRLLGFATGGLAYGAALLGAPAAHAVGGIAAALAPPLARVSYRLARPASAAALQSLRRFVLVADPRGRILENLWTGLRIRPGLALAAEVAVLGGALGGMMATAPLLPPARLEAGEAPFLLEDARPTVFDALEQASLPFALHNLRHS